MHRNVHKLTLEGDGQKPSRHENEGPLLIFVLGFLIYDVRKPKARIAEIVKFDSFEHFQNWLKAINACLFFQFSLFMFVFVLFVSSADRESEIEDRKLESWTL